MEKCLERLDIHFINYMELKGHKIRADGELPTAMDKKRNYLLRTVQEQEFKKARRIADNESLDMDEDQTEAEIEARALDEAADSLNISQSKGSTVSDATEVDMATATDTELDFQALTMEEVVDHTLVEFCDIYKLLIEGRFRKNHIMLTLKDNLVKQMQILKAKNDHDNKGKIIKLILI